ncbi:acyl-CoA dehydrogenase family protein [Sphingobium sp. Sx8-8]|uniref:acyl-CoA dehydrogenase family protein n=1 Tax=Sphingobium sp. Sx8-8 TaxID=2933617 RepID=UPI001F573239|nr:acyl-CoA dehydrogenase family protein [Sphingobium sp. Sx8-8]
MDLTPSEDQTAYQTATADWCRDHMPLEEARSRRPGLWSSLTEMGWIGMTAPDTGLDHATEALVFAELGRFLAPVALLSSAVGARWTGSGDKAAIALPAPDGSARLIDADGAASAVGLFDGELGSFALPGSLAAAPSLDLSATVARLDALPSIARVNDPRAVLHLRLLSAAFAIGAADAARDMATGYAKIREQFGRPIGWFQAIKHICADMAVRAAVARSQLYYAACALDAGESDAAFHVAAAKRLADQAAIDNGRANIQVHGGIGMTDEAAPHLCLKRAHLLQFIAPADMTQLLA